MPYPLPSGKSAWRYKAIPHLMGGMNTQRRADTLDDTQLVAGTNVLAKQDNLENDTGYVTFAGTVVGTPQKEYLLEYQDGTTDVMLITTSTLYKYDSGNKVWKLAKGTAGTTTTAQSGPGATTIIVNSAAGFSTGDLVGIDLSNGLQLQTTITISGTTFTLATPVPTGVNVPSGGNVIRAVALNGSLDHQVSVDTYPFQNWMVFTNGIDTPKKYDGLACVDIPNLPSAGNTICQVVIVYNAALFLLNTTEGGTHFPQRARRSNQGDPTNWTTGTAGTDDLLDVPDAIVGAKRLGPYLIVYRERSISRGQFVGSASLNYFFETMVSSDGALSAQSIIDDIPGGHLVLGNKNIYIYSGDYKVTPIGDSIFHRVWGKTGDLSPTLKDRSFLAYVPELDEVWLAYPSTRSTDGCDTILRLNRQHSSWFERKFADVFYGLSLFLASNDVSWSGLQGTWADQNWQWDQQTQTDQPFHVHLLGNGGQVFTYDFKSALDNGNAIQYTVETKDYLIQDKECRFDMLEMYIRGNAIIVSYSTNSGRTWQTFPESPLEVPFEDKVQLFTQFLFHKVRFRITGKGQFILGWLGFSYKEESVAKYGEVSP